MQFPKEMTLRDWFAGQAITGILAVNACYSVDAERAYEFADMMLAERAKPQQVKVEGAAAAADAKPVGYLVMFSNGSGQEDQTFGTLQGAIEFAKRFRKDSSISTSILAILDTEQWT